MRSIFILVLLGTVVPPLLAPVYGGEAPTSYVDRHGWLGVRLEQKPLPEGGIRIQEVVPGGPAQKGGLRNGDVLLVIRGEKITSLTMLVRRIASTRPGQKVAFHIRRRGKERTLVVEIGHRRQGFGPMIEGGRTAFAVPEAIHPEWVDAKTPFASFLEGSLKGRNRWDLYENLIAAFDRDEDLFQVFYKLNEVSYVRREPLKLPLSARQITDEFMAAVSEKGRGLPALLRTGAKVLDAPLPKPGPRLEGRPRAVLEGLAFARGLLNRAFGKLSGGERSFLFHQSLPLFEKFKDHIYLNIRSSEVMYGNNLQAIRISKRIDYTLLFMAGEMVARCAETAAALPARDWADLGAVLGKTEEGIATGDVIAAVRSPEGTIVIGGKGRTVYTEDAMLIIDLGGDDVYLNAAGGTTKTCPVSVVI
ncbi:MAG: S1C family serine protease, partial [Planctomycetota bacterium]